MNHLHPLFRRLLAYGAAIALPLPIHAGPTDIASGPLGQGATSLNPNLMLILDDSGSMGRQFTPDFVSTYVTPSGTIVSKNCFDTLDTGSGTALSASPEECWAGDPPAMSPDFNVQYYNAEIRYIPARNYDGSVRTSMTCENTGGTRVLGACVGGWTAVPTDNVSATGSDSARKNLHSGGSPGSASGNWGNDATPMIPTYNLVTNFPDRVWCLAAADAADSTNCRTNSSYTYPDIGFGFGLDSGGNRKYKLGAPYYYRIEPTEWCTDDTMTNCVASDDKTAVNGVNYHTPARVRFCTDATLTDCHAKRDSVGAGNVKRRYPKFLGAISLTGVPPVKATGKITVTNPQQDGAAGSVTSIMVNGAFITNGTLPLPAGQTATQWATLIRNYINSNSGTSGYTATSNNNVVTVAQPTVGAAGNGQTITVNTKITGTTAARITINITNTQRANTSPNWATVSSLMIDGLQFVGTTIVCNNPNCNSTTAGTRNNQMAAHIRTGVVVPAGWTVTGANNQVIITAPSTTGSEKNALAVAITANRTTATNASGGGMVLAGGVTTGDVNHTTQNFAGGADGTTQHVNVGLFVRTDLVAGATFNKFPGRTDCGVANCNYEQEMTNFANWFSYYRTRLQMAKTAIGSAFTGISDNFRVGFMTINFSTGAYRAVLPFDAAAGAQKDLWYQRLYATTTAGTTPLKTSLSRAGRYYANQNPGGNMGSSPIATACQPNYAILTSDGYWNDGSGAVNIANQALADPDGDGSSATLADVAHYYYNTDLSTGTTGAPSPAGGFKNNVRASGIDTAPHQHMTTFTVGMGVSGSLIFHPNYLEAGNSLDYDLIVAGKKQWPLPVADTETTVDDMWHAAVNGKGRFFSAGNPVALAGGLIEVLNSIEEVTGAGAAAATSNLQPVAGDNFAFTAEYRTRDWYGDLKAKTIGLTDGLIATRSLWSAQKQLDQRTDLDRKIYTYDAGDTVPGANVTVGAIPRTQNGNRLRSFCPEAQQANANCNDGGLLTQPELDNHFDPKAGTNGPLLQTQVWVVGDPRLDNATKESLVRYLRGETANEMVIAGVGPTDLYRNREHLLGDIVNAQPAYVKGSPFSYSAATDPFYGEFRSLMNGTTVLSGRKGTVYVAANDGMLHAFETDPDNKPYYQVGGMATEAESDDTFAPDGTLNTSPVVGEGAERWAYIPSMLFSTLKRLAEEQYPVQHRFYTDGSPQVGDVCFGHTKSTPCTGIDKWHTVLVGGLNAGGRGYYALDVTTPDTPKALWELHGGDTAVCLSDAQANSGSFTEDCNIGLTFGNPIITKRPADGRWVVLVTSGHNNIIPGDGRGYLYVVDVESGRILQRLSTGVGALDTPSGLGRINAWAENALLENTALAVYGGDLQGNLWRFQLDHTTAVPRNSVTLLASVRDPSNVPQPITTRPELGEVSGNRVVFVGTGKFLGETDKITNQRQTIYAIKDTLVGTSTVHDMTRTASGIASFVPQIVTEVASATNAREVANPNPVDWKTQSGWFVDLPDGGSGLEAAERVNVDPILQLGTLVVPSNVPSSESCVAGGSGWINFLDFRTGATVQTGVNSTPVSLRIAGSLVVGINVVKIGNSIKTIVTTADNQNLTETTPTVPSAFGGRRVTWRELFVE